MQRWLGLHKGHVAAKLHVVYDPAAQRPVFFDLTRARINDITAAKFLLPIEPGATYVFDLGYYDFAWWAELVAAGCTFVTRLKANTTLRDTEAREVTPGGSVLADQVGYLPERLTFTRHNPFEHKGREITIRIDNGKVLRLFTNDLTSPAEQIAALYKERWQIELFFKWIKQNLRISKFIGTSENAIRAQIAVAFIAYVLVRMLQAVQAKTYAPADTGDHPDSPVRAPRDRRPARPQHRQTARTNHLFDPAPLPPRQLTCQTAVGQARPSSSDIC